MGDTIISWNLANWITVLLMALVGYALFVGAVKLFNRNGGEND